MRFGHTYAPPGYIHSAIPGRLVSSALADKTIRRDTKSYQAAPADGDRFGLEFYCDGSETKLQLGTVKDTSCGIFDLYINGVLDSAGYDDYNAGGSSAIQREITLTLPVRAGYNLVELVVNGKNVGSSNYYLSVYTGVLQ